MRAQRNVREAELKRTVVRVVLFGFVNLAGAAGNQANERNKARNRRQGEQGGGEPAQLAVACAAAAVEAHGAGRWGDCKRGWALSTWAGGGCAQRAAAAGTHAVRNFAPRGASARTAAVYVPRAVLTGTCACGRLARSAGPASVLDRAVQTRQNGPTARIFERRAAKRRKGRAESNPRGRACATSLTVLCAARRVATAAHARALARGSRVARATVGAAAQQCTRQLRALLPATTSRLWRCC